MGDPHPLPARTPMFSLGSGLPARPAWAGARGLARPPALQCAQGTPRHPPRFLPWSTLALFSLRPQPPARPHPLTKPFPGMRGRSALTRCYTRLLHSGCNTETVCGCLLLTCSDAEQVSQWVSSAIITPPMDPEDPNAKTQKAII